MESLLNGTSPTGPLQTGTSLTGSGSHSSELNHSSPDSGLLCSYRNVTERMRIVRCCGPGGFFLERVVFPFELLTFHCPAASDVEIWARDQTGVVLSERLCADDLAMEQSESSARPEWLPQIPERRVGVRGNASSVSLLPPDT